MATMIKNPAEKLLAALSARIDDELSALLPPGTPCALVDFPNHPNAGDSAIWSGECAWLERHGHPLVYGCDLDHYSRETLAACLGDGIILLHGGGNFGDVWAAHQAFRERVIADFPDHRIVQLPQTIHFQHPANLARTRAALTAHRHFTLLCRDRPSYELAQREFGVPSRLCPDLAFALGPLERPSTPTHPVLWLARTDREASQQPVPPDEPGVLLHTDWLAEPRTESHDRLEGLLRDVRTATADEQRRLQPRLIETFRQLARQRLERGCRVLSQGETVITDRLHGHILCLLLGLPHVLLDNNYGKVHGFYTQWTHGNALTRLAASSREAVETALPDLLDDPGTQASSGLIRAIDVLRSGLISGPGWQTPRERAEEDWQQQVAAARRELEAVVDGRHAVLLVDEEQLRDALAFGPTVRPFPEQHGAYGGPPVGDEQAIDELERQRGRGARFLVLAWPAFWWLDYYPGWQAHLRRHFRQALQTERVLVFDLG